MEKSSNSTIVDAAHVLRNIVYFTAAQGVSNVGTWMQKTAIGWLAWELTHSVAWVGAVALSDLVAALWVAPLAGAMADRGNPYRQLAFTQTALLILTLGMAVLTGSGHLSIWILMGFSLIDATFQGFNQPVRAIATGMLAGPARMSQAIASNSIAFNAARGIGPLLAGLLLAGGQTSLVFVANSLSFVAMLGTIFYLRSALHRPPLAAKGALAADIGEGFRYVIQTPEIAMLFLLALTFSVLARPFAELFPAFAGAIFEGGPQTLSMLMSAQGVGAIIGAAWMLRKHGRQSLVVICYVSALGTGLSVLVFTAIPSLAVALPALALAGLFHVVCNIAMQSIAQISAAPAMRGRVMSLYGLIFRAGPSVGAFTIGLATPLFGLQLLVGSGALIFFILVLVMWPRARRVYVPA